MALRRQNLSPTANLLRNSRLFALPNPLPRPNVSETVGAGVLKASDTATLPFPTHQAIATTPSSLARGDWGLKRPLPSKSYLLQTSNPVLKVTQLDTIEHVTDFDSAADHVRTRQKWEEMSIPMVKGMGHMRDLDRTGSSPAGAFERRDDVTSYDTDEGLDEAGLYLQALKESAKKNSQAASQSKTGKNKNASPFTPFTPPPIDVAVHNSRRWKHDGPWLPGMSAEGFTTYVSTTISQRREEFNKYLVEFVKNEIYMTRQLAASKQSGEVPLDEKEAAAWHKKQEKQWSNINKEDVAAAIKALRKEAANDPLGAKLTTKLILPFLRLPSIRLKSIKYAQDASQREIEQWTFDHDAAPLSTHPSAGLGYLRSRAYLSNHPVLGPQGNPTPVTARVVQARSSGLKKDRYARLGVGGFVTNDDHHTAITTNVNHWNRNDVVESIDIKTPGGAKLMVQPHFGSVSNNGRIHIKIKRSTGGEVQVAQGLLDDTPPVRENVQSDPMSNLSSSVGRSGVTELDEQSDAAQQFQSVMDQFKPQARQPGARQSGGPRGGFTGTRRARLETDDLFTA